LLVSLLISKTSTFTAVSAERHPKSAPPWIVFIRNPLLPLCSFSTSNCIVFAQSAARAQVLTRIFMSKSCAYTQKLYGTCGRECGACTATATCSEAQCCCVLHAISCLHLTVLPAATSCTSAARKFTALQASSLHHHVQLLGATSFNFRTCNLETGVGGALSQRRRAWEILRKAGVKKHHRLLPTRAQEGEDCRGGRGKRRRLQLLPRLKFHQHFS